MSLEFFKLVICGRVCLENLKIDHSQNSISKSSLKIDPFSESIILLQLKSFWSKFALFSSMFYYQLCPLNLNL